MGMGVEERNRLAERAAQEIEDGMIVNLGIGIPSLVANYISPDSGVMFHAENGILGMGEAPEKGHENPNLCNAGGFPVTVVQGASYFDSATAFGMIRGGYLDVTILGGLEVSRRGDLANWIVPGKRVSGVGGAMELAAKAKKVIALMSHTSKNGEPKIVEECALPLTARQCVHLIITDMAVIEVTADGLVLQEVMEPYSIKDVVEKTGAPLHIARHLETVE
ncbi:3-oxoacid CoA-transferase subunit B [Planococcus lenghuensis]|uniref:Acyl CoA:acetate/3-ketoacid CoA transferase subunit beta n=1 Tax=Planococcus lenghuensis TaxID=2213202 RepID=A0A1Q2KVZ4_9BACL|nr:3-oxoacid CoA-transferase subunit B [Planococcus lenghuensis]AQQ52359.1 acyl CoA:acetate/3-ketoacid CoA transferase subunit beta [Planococcus lenghuensis]